MEMEKVFDHKAWEERVLSFWEEKPYFEAVSHEGKEKFSIIMPPPNANDPLHVGHAMFVAIEDILIRYNRMKGRDTLWLPGTDHAGIETQYVYEKKLAKEGKSRFDYRREDLYAKIFEYVGENSKVAIDQIKRLGASIDMSRYKFTLDEDVVKFVKETFVKMNEDKLIYRSEKIVNYCTRCGTSYSELEVDWDESVDKLYTISYKIRNSDQVINVATVRPETIFADVAVAVHPDDKRYAHLIGGEVLVPMTDRYVPIIGSEKVEIEFGTGALKITPGHDSNDFEIWTEHIGSTPILNKDYDLAVDHRGKLTSITLFAGQNVTEGRATTVEKLKTEGLLVAETEYTHRVGKCYRCGRVIEPLPLPQVLLRVETMAKAAIESLNKKEVVIHGAGREEILRQWLTNLRDWNISRQIVWGIRIPIWYKVDLDKKNIMVNFINKDGKLVEGAYLSEVLKEGILLSEVEKGIQRVMAETGVNEPEWIASIDSPGDNFIQETDTFDTWFSSGQWPVVTLKTGKEGDFENFYPTSVMETAYDILIFWVMRMMIMGIYLTGKAPFKDVYLHGLIRDDKGQKMSKSKGNVVNPLDMVDKYGADALRMALVMSSTPGMDKGVSEAQIKGMRNLANKMWNATRYVLMMEENISTTNRAFLEKLEETVKTTEEHLERLRPGQAAEYVYNQFWHWYCDESIEASKKGEISKKDMLVGIETFLKLFHPFTPFVSEAIWSQMNKETRLAVTSWPSKDMIRV